MAVENRFFSGVVTTWAHFFIAAALSLFMAPILVHRLGNESYGLWSLYMTVIGYFTLFDFGLSPAILKYSSKYQVTGDRTGERRLIATAFAILLGLSVMIFVAVLAGTLFYEYLFPATQIPKWAARLAFFFVGFGFVFSMPLSTFRGVLLGHQRYAPLNAILILNRVSTMLLIVLLVGAGGTGLVTLAAIFMGTSVLKDIAMFVLCRPQLKDRPGIADLDRQAARDLVSYSFPAFVVAISQRLISYTDSLVIGYVIGVGAVTYFALAGSLVDYVNEIGWSLARVLIPVVSGHEARGEVDEIRQRFLQFTRYCVWLSVPILFISITLGRAFFTRWVGPEYQVSAQILTILIVASTTYVIQQPAHAVLRGMSLHKRIAHFMTIEAILNLGLSIFLARRMGIVGVALGTLIPRVLMNCIAMPMYTLRALRVSVREYFVKGFAPALPGIGALLVLMWGIRAVLTDDAGWIVMVAVGLINVSVFVGITLMFGADAAERQWVRGRALRALQRVYPARRA